MPQDTESFGPEDQGQEERIDNAGDAGAQSIQPSEPAIEPRQVNISEATYFQALGEIWRAIIALNGRLWLILADSDGGAVEVQRGNGSARLEAVSARRLCHVVMRCVALWKTLASGESRRVKPWADLGQDLLEYEAKGLPPVVRVIDAPARNGEGALVTKNGYCPETGFYLTLEDDKLTAFPKRLPARGVPLPDKSVPWAISFLRDELLGNFPFADEASAAHALAAILTPHVRSMIAGPTPLFVITKPAEGVGASLLSEAIGLVSTGKPPIMLSDPRNDDEAGKLIHGALVQNPAAICFDNVHKPLAYANLCKAITQTRWRGRFLGTNRIGDLPNDCVWIANGINVSASSEVLRRTLPIKLDAGCEAPHLRQGLPDLRALIAQKQAECFLAAAIISHHWIARGRPAFSGKTLGSFEAYANCIGGMLEAAGVPGFLDNAGQLGGSGRDDEREALLSFLERVFEEFGERSWTISQVFLLAVDLDPPLLGDRGIASQKKALGKLLGRVNGQIFNGLRFTVGPKYKGSRTYSLKRVAPPKEDLKAATPTFPQDAPDLLEEAAQPEPVEEAAQPEPAAIIEREAPEEPSEPMPWESEKTPSIQPEVAPATSAPAAPESRSREIEDGGFPAPEPGTDAAVAKNSSAVVLDREPSRIEPEGKAASGAGPSERSNEANAFTSPADGAGGAIPPPPSAPRGRNVLGPAGTVGRGGTPSALRPSAPMKPGVPVPSVCKSSVPRPPASATQRGSNGEHSGGIRPPQGFVETTRNPFDD